MHHEPPQAFAYSQWTGHTRSARVRRRLLTSRGGGGWNERKRYAEILETQATEDEARPTRFGPQQISGLEQPSFAGIKAGVPTRNRRVHRVVLLGAAPVLQQDRGYPVPHLS